MSSVARSSFVMFLGTFVSRILGLVRSPLLFAIAVGVNYPAGNAFDIANRLPTLIYMLVAGGVVNAVLVPAILRAAKRDSDGGAAYINKLVTLGLVVLGSISLVLTLASPLLIKLFASGLSGDWYHLAVLFAYLCVPQVFFYGMYTLLGQILNAKENFGPYMWAPALNNIVAIAGMLAMIFFFGKVDPDSAWAISSWPIEKTLLLGGSATLGIIAQALILLIPLARIGVRLSPDFKFRGAGLSSAAKSGMWVLMSLGFGMIPTILISNVASVASDKAADMAPEVALGVAGNAAYTAAYSLYSLPTSLVVVSIVTAMFTRMAASAADNNMPAVRSDMSIALRVVAVFSFLATALLVVLAVPAVRVISPGSSWAEVESIGRVLMAMSLGLVGVGSFTAIQRVYYALERAKQLFFVQIPFIVLQSLLILATLTFEPGTIVFGVGISMAVANTLTPIAALYLLRGHLDGIDGKRLATTYLQLAGITAITVLVGYGLLHLMGSGPLSVFGALWRLIVISLAMVAVFLGLMKMLKMKEIAPLTRIIGRLGAKVRRTSVPSKAAQTTLGQTQTIGGTVSTLVTPGQRLRDRYELVAPMTSHLSGDFETWKGNDTVLDTPVRIILVPSGNENTEEILDSARRGVFVDDVRLVKLLSIFETDDYSAIVTEIPSGTPLSAYIEAGAIEHDQARAIVGEVAGALDAGVRRGVRHSSLRPDVVSIDDDGAVFLDGLGIDAAMSGKAQADQLSSERDRIDSRNLSLLLATCLLGKRVEGDDNEFLTEASELDIPSELSTLLSSEADGDGARSAGDFIRTIVPWGSVSPSKLPTPTGVDDGEETVVMTPPPAPPAEETVEETAVQQPVADTPPPPEQFASRHANKTWNTSPTWDEVNTEEEPEAEESDRRGITTGIILGSAALLVVLGGVWAFGQITKGTTPVTLEPETPIAEETTPPADEQTTEPTEEPTTEAPVELPAPEVASVTLLNPQAELLDPTTVDQQDAPAAVPNMIDGDPSTSWSSWWYSDPGFWKKEGIGLEITLTEESAVNEVVLNVNGNGGLVEWRDTVPAAPNSGQVIADASMSAETVIAAPEPVATSTIVLWFEDLPTAPDGQYRVEISELTVR